jgi:TonB family protein
MSFLSPELKPYLKISIGFHLSLFLFFGVKVLIFPDLSDLDQDGTIKVDMVALPNLEDNKKVSKADAKPNEKKVEPKKPEPKKEIAKPKPVEKTKTAQKTPEKKVEAEPKIDESSAFAKLQELQALKKLQEPSVEAEVANAPVFDESLIKGNRLAVGDSITGVSRINYDNYKQVLHNAVKNKWNLPSWIQDGNLFAEALIKISDTGHVTEKVLTTSSGNTMYDKYVLQAINEASPFPAPPDKFVNIVGVKGVVLRFP